MADEKNFEISEEILEGIAGGQGSGQDDEYLYDLGYFIARQVHCDSSSCLTLRKSPNGETISGYNWQNGDEILVHGSYSEGSWLYAYKNGKYGYVDGSCVW